MMSRALLARRSWVSAVAVVIGLTLAVVVRAQEADPAIKKFAAANGLFQRQLYNLAAERYEEFLKDFPKHPEGTTARYALAVCRFRLAEFGKAAAGLEEVLKDPQFKQGEDALLMLGHAYLNGAKYDKAVAAFDRLLKEHPGGPRAESASLGRAQAFYLAGKFAEAARACEQFLQAYPASAQRGEALYFLGIAQHEAGHEAESVAALGQLLAKYPDSPRRIDAMLVLAQALDSAGKPDDAVAQLQKLIDAAPADRKAEAMLSLAMLEYRRGKYDDSIGTLSRLLNEHAASASAGPARLQLGLAQLAAGRIDDARKTLNQVALGDASRAGTARYWLAQCDIAEKKYDLALRALDELGKSPAAAANADRIAFDRARCLMGLGNYAAAASAYSAFIDRYPAHAQAQEAAYYQAFCLHKAGQFEQSLDLARSLTGGGTFAGAAKELVGENLFLLARYDQAARSFSELLAAAPADRKVRFTVRLGQCAYFSKDYARAVELLMPIADNEALTEDRELVRSLLLLGDALLQTNRNAEAATVLGKYVPMAGSDRTEAQFKLALAQIRSNQTVAGERTLMDLMRGPADSPWTVRATFEYGQLNYKLKEMDKAAEALGTVVKAKGYPELSAAAEYLLGWIDYDSRRYEPAAHHFETVVRNYPDDAQAADAMFYRGVALREAGLDEKAIEALKQYVGAHINGRNVPQARQLIAASLVKLQKHDEAIKALTALAADPRTVTDAVLYDLAWSQGASKDSAEAEKTYRLLLRRFPTSKLIAPAKSELGELLFQQGKYEPAAELLQQVMTDKSAEPRTVSVALYRLGSCYEKLNQPAKAAKIYEDFLATHKGDELAAWAHYQAGVNMLRQRKLGEAQQHFEQALASNPKADLAAVSLLKLGETQAERTAYDASEKTYQQFLAKFPQDKLVTQAQFGIGWSLENRQRYAEARQWYQKVVDATNSMIAARAQFQIGETWFAEGKYDQAVASLLAVVDVYAYPQWSARALLEAGRAFEQLKQPQEAVKQYQQVVSKYKDAPEAELAAKRLKVLGTNQER